MGKNPEGEQYPWRFALAVCVTFGVPLLFVVNYPMNAATAWVALIVVYFGLLRLFGTKFLIEGAIAVTVLSILVTIMISAVHRLNTRTDLKPTDSSCTRSP